MTHISTLIRPLRWALFAILALFLLLGTLLFFSRLKATGSSFLTRQWDRTVPDVSIVWPESEPVVKGTVSIKVLASDENAIRFVKLYKDGVLFNQDALAPYDFLWSTALEANGTYMLRAEAIDVNGNKGSSQAMKFEVSNSPTTARPNIVVVVTDDQRWDTMQYMPLTNSLLYAESVRFNNAIAAVPLCCPSRSSIFTGLYCHNHGVRDNFAPYGGALVFTEKGLDKSTIATWLDGAGYRTGLFGKYLNAYDKISPYVPPGWDQFYAFLNDNGNYYNYSLVENGVVVSYGNKPEEYATSVIAGKAVQFIKAASPGDPVFVYFAPFAPHSTYGKIDSLPTAGPGDEGTYAFLDPWRPASYNEKDVSEKPLWVQNLPPLSASNMQTGDQFRIKQIESLQAVDRAVADLIEALVQTGRYDNTIFVYLSDNGLSWGEHRWNMKKWCAYEECIRIPFWVRVPGLAGRDDEALVNDVDLGPTLAEFAGVIPTRHVDGLSLVDRIKNPEAPWLTEAYTEYISPAMKGDQMIFRELRTATAAYIEYANGDRELYDLEKDPLQLDNLVNDPGYAQILKELLQQLQILEEK